jgi:signal transduction histidine kinase
MNRKLIFWYKLPLRIRLSIKYSLLFVSIVVLMNVGVYTVVHHALYREIEQELRLNTRLVQRTFAEAPADAVLDPLIILPPRVEGLETTSSYLQISNLMGGVLRVSPNLGGQRLVLSDAQLRAAIAGESSITTVILGRARILVLTTALRAAGTPVAIMQIGQSLHTFDITIRILSWSLLTSTLVSLVAAVRGGMQIAERSLQPVTEITDAAQQIVHTSDLSRRIPLMLTDDEISKLINMMNAMISRLEALFIAQRRFVADVSHELRTPLTAMRGHLEMIQLGLLTDGIARQESVTDMMREVMRMKRMTDDLLLLAQSEAGLPIHFAPVVLDDIVLQVVRELRPLCDGVVLVPRIEEQVEINADGDRIKQALINMVANAIQHTPSGGRVTVSLWRDQACAFLEVQDTGLGIDAHDLPYVFDRFYRTDRSRMRRSGGAGIGLSIVRWIVRAHQGEVSVESRPNHGAIFTISIPFQSAEARH